jgi:hypothetical protein
MLTRVSTRTSWLMSYAYRPIIDIHAFQGRRGEASICSHVLSFFQNRRNGQLAQGFGLDLICFESSRFPSPDSRFDTHEPYRRRRATAGPTNSSIIPKRPLSHSRPERRAQAWETTSTSNSLPSPTRSLRIHHNPCYLCTKQAIQHEQATTATNSNTCHTALHATGALCQ